MRGLPLKEGKVVGRIQKTIGTSGIRMLRLLILRLLILQDGDKLGDAHAF